MRRVLDVVAPGAVLFTREHRGDPLCESLATRVPDALKRRLPGTAEPDLPMNEARAHLRA